MSEVTKDQLEGERRSVPGRAEDSLSADQLPPVEPPSASFIMQLFLVPGLIVAAVIGVWALFGKLSSGEQDWRQLISELRSTNEHRRWRGANALAQVLRADAELGDSGQKLATNPQIAQELATVLNELLDATSNSQELISQQSFVARTLGWLDSAEIVFPPLLRATKSEYDTIVRTDAMRSVAIIAGRADEAGRPIENKLLVERFLEVSNDANPLIRQLAAFTLGLLPGPEADQRLKVLAEDEDKNTRVNAGIALSRRKLPDGYSVIVEVLKKAPQPVNPDSMDGKTEEERKHQAQAQESINVIALANTLRAIRNVAPVLTAAQRDEVLVLCQSVANDFPLVKVRMEAEETLRSLKAH